MNTKTTTTTNNATALPSYVELCLDLINVEMSLDRIAAREHRLKQQTGQDTAKLARVLKGRSRQLNWKAEAIVNLMHEHYGIEPKRKARQSDRKANVVTMPFIPKTAA